MKPLAGRQRLNPFSRMQPHPAPLARIVRQALGRRPVSGDIPIKPVNHDKDRARFSCAATAQCRKGALNLAAPEIGGHPDVGTQSHGMETPERAARTRSVRGFNSPVTGKSRSRSKFCIAARVPGPFNPSTLT